MFFEKELAKDIVEGITVFSVSLICDYRKQDKMFVEAAKILVSE